MLLMEGRRASRKSAGGNLDTFDCCMRALWHFALLAPEHHDQAAALPRQAIKLDPNLAQAHMMLARMLVGRTMYVWSGDPDKDISKGYEAAARSISLDDCDPYAHYTFCWASC
jgi:hypothetical protein